MKGKPSLKSLAGAMQPPPSAAPAVASPPAKKSYRTASTRIATRQISGHFPAGDVQACRIMAEENDMDVGEMLAQAMNMAFERYGKPNRINIVSGRRKRFYGTDD